MSPILIMFITFLPLCSLHYAISYIKPLMKSKYSLLIVSLVWFLLGAFYYPKWNKPGSEAAISWDVSGYYQYLPAIFIYKDIKKQDFMGDINAKYLPSPAYDQTFGHHDSGNLVT